MAILDDIGKLAGGAIDVAGKVAGGTRIGSRIAANERAEQQSEVNQLLATYKAIDPSTQEGAEKRSEILSQIQQTPTFQKFTADAGAAINAQVNRTAATKRISDLALAGKRAGDGGFTTPELDAAISKKTEELFADMGIVGELSNEVGGAQKIRLSSLFDSGIDSLKKTSKGKLATTDETQAFADKFISDAEKAGVSTSAAQVLFGELHDEEAGKRGVFRNDVLPKGSRAADFFAETPGTPEPKASEEKTIKAFEEFVQVGTAEFPEDNTPKNFKALGIETTADQQQFQELEKAAPQGIDVQQIAQQNPEDFKRMLAALRTGKTPSGKKFTIKDALKLMGNL